MTFLMAVSFEDIEAAIERIERQGDGMVTSRKRVLLPNAKLL